VFSGWLRDDTDAGRHTLIAVARYLAVDSPTERAAPASHLSLRDANEVCRELLLRENKLRTHFAHLKSLL